MIGTSGDALSALPDAAISAWLKDRGGYFDQLVASVDEYAIFTMSPEGIVLDWNPGAERLQGYSASEIVGRHFSQFYSEEQQRADLPQKALETALREGRFSDEIWRSRKDGTRFWAAVTITAIRSESGHLETFLEITRDLTERKLAEETLRQSEEGFRLLVESVQDYAIFMLDPEGHVMTWNQGARRIKGYEANEIIGKHFSTFYPAEALAIDLPPSLLRQATREGRAEDEGWRVRKDGTRFWGNVVITALYDSARELRGFAKITRDLSERQRVKQLQEAGKRKDAFLAMLAHELRNPLAPLLQGVELIAQAPDNTAVVTRVADIVRRQVDQMARLIDDLLDMSRISAGKIALRKSALPLEELLDAAVEIAAPLIQERQHSLETDVPEGIMVEADPHRLAQMVSNLLSNAAKYTPPGGRIRLAAQETAKGLLSVTVKDNGMGVPLDLQHSIFDLFDQGSGGSAEGLGIGLTLVKTLAELHGGCVRVNSEGEGKGSEFTLLLPILVASDSGRAGEARQAAARKPGPARVLVADDGRNAADILRMFFDMEGMDTAIAYDGEEAVEVATDFVPDFVFLDLGMPKLDGYEAARRIRSIHPHAVLVALSGWGTEEDRQRSRAAGFDAHLLKPAKPDELRAVLNAYCSA